MHLVKCWFFPSCQVYLCKAEDSYVIASCLRIEHKLLVALQDVEGAET